MKTFPHNETARRTFLLCLILSIFIVSIYIVVSYLQSGDFGFPLDDAWIHQVYARNLGTRFEFSFFAGQPSAGSTSPLWAVLLGIGYFLRIDFRLWAILLGILFLAASGWMAGRVTRRLVEDNRIANWIVPLFVILEWHMVWAAASGMEIVLFVFLAVALVDIYFDVSGGGHETRPYNEFVLIGVLAGLLVLTRPDGILLVGLVGLGLAYQSRRNLFAVSTLVSLFTCLLVFFLLLIPYFYFNFQASGTLLPNTFYAKGAEYAELTTQTNFFVRWLSMYRQPLIGAQLLLIPGLLYGVFVLARAKDWIKLLPALWIVVLPALYAWRLPVEYQFGRYMMPIIPFVIVYGVVGTALLFKKIPMRLLQRAWAMTIAVLLVAFLFLGVNLYTQSVAVVNCEMAAVAKWTQQNVPPGALLAVHDIGAQGYFDAHPILDLAGLVSPEVIPFIRDEAKLKAWMMARGAQYAVFFPTWYPNLAKDAPFHEIYSTDCATTREMGEENLGVYQIE